MNIFVDVKETHVSFSHQGQVIYLTPIGSIFFDADFKSIVKLINEGGEVEAANLKFKGGDYPNFYIDAGFLTEEVVRFTKDCNIPNIFAVKHHNGGFKVLASSGKSLKKLAKKECGAMTHQETTDRINALGYALGVLNDLPKSAFSGSSNQTPTNKAIDDIAKELSLITTHKQDLKND